MSAAMAKAAAKERSTAAEWAKRRLRAALLGDGVELPLFAVGEASTRQRIVEQPRLSPRLSKKINEPV
jgi:hypothetical protein